MIEECLWMSRNIATKEPNLHLHKRHENFYIMIRLCIKDVGLFWKFKFWIGVYNVILDTQKLPKKYENQKYYSLNQWFFFKIKKIKTIT